MNQKVFILTLLSFYATTAQATWLYGVGKIHLDYQVWDQGLGNDADNFGNAISDRNQALVGIEGAAGFDWGQLYGFYDYEGIDRSDNNRGASAKATMHYNLTDSGISLYLHIYDTQRDSTNYHEQTRVLGTGYTGLKGHDWAFTPFIGVSQINTAGIHGYNGEMAGWVGFYNTDIGGEHFTFSTWGEYEFNRNAKYAASQGGRWGLNGSINAFWNINQHWSVGMLYRYTVNKLARKDYQDLFIYRLQYTF